MKYEWKYRAHENAPYYRANVEEYLPEDPHFENRPFGMRLENGNFVWARIDQVEQIEIHR